MPTKLYFCGMSKKRLFALIVVVLLITAVITNPSAEKHEEAIKEKAEFILKQQLNYEHEDAVQLGMVLFGDRVVQQFVQSNIVIKNYYLFSVVQLRWQGEEATIGVGALGKVWLSGRIDEEVDKVIRALKEL